MAGLRDWFSGWVYGPKSAEVVEPVREAAGVNVDADDHLYRKLTGNSQRDLSPMNQARMQSLAYYLWESNLIANRLIELPVAFLLAEGVTLTVNPAGDMDDKAMEPLQEVVRKFWHDPINAMDMKLEKKVRELSIYGDQCWPAFVNEMTGHVRLGYIDPCDIDVVVTDPDNIEQPIGVVTKKDKKGNFKKLRVIVPGEEPDLFTQRTRRIRALDFTDGQCFYFKVNDLSNSSRGRSDLLGQIDWLDSYDEFMFGELDRSQFMRAFIWDITLKGATPEEVEKRAKEVTVPRPGSVRVHNDAEEWSAVTPDLNSGDSETVARLMRNHMLGGATMPEHWFGGGGDVNRATGESMSEPTLKMLSQRQQRIKYILEYVGQFVVLSALRVRGEMGVPHDGFEVEAVFPEMSPKDTSKFAAALAQVTAAVIQMIDAGLMSDETGVTIIGTIVGRLGVELDPETLLAEARDDKADRDAEDVLNDLPSEQVLRIPMRSESRSLNLSNSAAVVVYEAWRQVGFSGLS